MTDTISLPTQEQIQTRAYEMYLARGCEPGKDVDDWLIAEIELLLESAASSQKRLRTAAPTKSLRMAASGTAGSATV